MCVCVCFWGRGIARITMEITRRNVPLCMMVSLSVFTPSFFFRRLRLCHVNGVMQCSQCQFQPKHATVS